MNPTARIRLSVMMFIQFFVWGVWFVTLGTYLGKEGLGFLDKDIGNAYSTTNWAAIVSPFFIGMVADRFFSAEKVMGILHLLGGLILYYLSTITDPGKFFFIALAYALCYMPTLALVNAISFHQMSDPGKQFPGVRVLGTIGWIVAGFVASYLGESTNRPIIAAAVASILLGVYSFTLPNTPPKSHGKRVTVSDVLGLDALRLLKDFSFTVFIICSLLICIPLAFYYNFTNPFLNAHDVANAAAKQTMGQMSEVFFMLVMPFFFARLGVKKMLLVGMIAWAVRYFFFAYGTPSSLIWMWYIGILLHGVCYDFFFVTGQLYVDKKAPEDIRASAQGFIGLVTYGAGMAIGSVASGHIVGYFKLAEPIGNVAHNWKAIWLVPGTMAIVITVLFMLFFRENNKDKASA